MKAMPRASLLSVVLPLAVAAPSELIVIPSPTLSLDVLSLTVAEALPETRMPSVPLLWHMFPVRVAASLDLR
jgi:hypothetical protein